MFRQSDIHDLGGIFYKTGDGEKIQQRSFPSA